MTTRIAGLPAAAEPPGLVTPLAAVAVIKGLDRDGRVRYWRVATADVTDVEAVGMHEVASAMYKQALPR